MPLEPVSHRNNPGLSVSRLPHIIMLSSRRFRIIRGAYLPAAIISAASTKYPNGFAGYDMMYNGSVLACRPNSAADASSRPEHMCIQPCNASPGILHTAHPKCRNLLGPLLKSLPLLYRRVCFFVLPMAQPGLKKPSGDWLSGLLTINAVEWLTSQC